MRLSTRKPVDQLKLPYGCFVFAPYTPYGLSVPSKQICVQGNKSEYAENQAGYRTGRPLFQEGEPQEIYSGKHLKPGVQNSTALYSFRAYIPVTLRESVVARAGRRCEYCLIHQDDTPFSHHIDHFIPLKHGGQSVGENLVLACLECNQYKGSDLAAGQR